jgi:hypothetical protein
MASKEIEILRDMNGGLDDSLSGHATIPLISPATTLSFFLSFLEVLTKVR